MPTMCFIDIISLSYCFICIFIYIIYVERKYTYIKKLHARLDTRNNTGTNTDTINAHDLITKLNTK